MEQALGNRCVGRGCALQQDRENAGRKSDMAARQPNAQALSATSQLRKNSALGPAQRGSDFLGALALQVKQHDGPPVALRQALELVIQDRSKVAPAQVVVRLRSWDIDHRSLPRALSDVRRANLARNPIGDSIEPIAKQVRPRK